MSLEGHISEVAHFPSIYTPLASHMATSSCKRSWQVQSLFLATMCSATKLVSSVTKRERKMIAGEELACCLGKSDDAVENIAECIHQRTNVGISVCPISSLNLSFLTYKVGMMVIAS